MLGATGKLRPSDWTNECDVALHYLKESFKLCCSLTPRFLGTHHSISQCLIGWAWSCFITGTSW